ncbi:hypothetical protein BKA58DRAFT_412372 [Alternaria rosae]|uniref:uncharacterized protein n=1 Tax=Alternaria rosae TaxID=1187941 RepID=UPI001E8ED2E4|nr:uncharacterized protein BKA58DRAFT_412372 [Alternaria rosae]KAH6868698.1 hypothetical protein BKA58DRAFT_412372 [Alternaria rosae]
MAPIPSLNLPQCDPMAFHPNASTDFMAESPTLRTKPILTRPMIEADDFCMKSQSIAPLLACIWKYSSMHVSSPPTTIELVAGHRYWLPCGCLAEEWITFFTFAEKWLDLAPPEVRSAYEEEQVSNFGVWPSFARTMQDDLSTHYDLFLPGEMSGQFVPRGLHSQHLRRRIDPTMTDSKTLRVTEKTPYLDVAREPSNASAFNDGYGQANSARLDIAQTTGLRRGLLLGPLSGISPHALRQSSAAPVGLSLQPSPFLAPVAPQHLSSTQPTQHGPQARPLLASVQPTTQVPVFPLQSVRSGAAAFEQNPAAPPVFHQLLQAKGINTAGFRPGSVLPGGNNNTAWSAERIRAFVEIEGKSIQRLPSLAFSVFGTEMTNFRTPASVDMRCCPFETSLEEMFTFFPNTCTPTRETCVRAMQHWSPMDISRYINYAHNTQTPGICSRSKISYHFTAAVEWQKEHPNFVPTASLRNVSTDSLLKGENRILHDFFLYNMGDGVTHPPAGRQAQMLTHVIEHVRRVTRDRHVRLSQAAAYARRYSITVPAHEQMNFTNLAVEDQLPSAARLLTMKVDYWNKFGEHP